MKTLVLLAIFSGLVFSSCYFDTNLGRSNCIEEKMVIKQAVVKIMPITTPEEHLDRSITGLNQFLKGNKKISNLSNETARKMLFDFENIWNITHPITIVQNITKIEVKNESNILPSKAIKPKRSASECTSARIKDWEFYCQSMHSQGIDIDCYNTNINAKDEILDRLANMTQSYQGRCING